MITPINGHILIEPVVHDSFMSTQSETYQEIGTVIAVSEGVMMQVGSRVYFDSWMAAKYPKSDTLGDYYWLVKYEDVRAVDND